MFRREVAAYELSRLLGYDGVPETVIREVEGEIGSVQRKVEKAEVFEYVSFSERNQVSKGEFVKMYIFDCIIYSSDRHESNVLIKDDRLVAIDNGLSFGDEFLLFDLRNRKLKRGAEVPLEMKGKLEELLLDDEKMQEIFTMLKKYLKFSDAIACIKRIEHVAKRLQGNDWKLPRGLFKYLSYNPEKDDDKIGLIEDRTANNPDDEYSTSDRELLEAI